MSGAVNRAAPVVTLKDGLVSGKEELSTKGKEFFSYYGIPYAKPPVEELRFKDPVPVDKWPGIKDGSRMPPPSLQTSFGPLLLGRTFGPDEMLGAEDCLYLNVFTPKEKKPQEKLPVMVWLHGGGFLSGGGYNYLPYVLMNHNIVLVVLQFRLGVLGFLSTEDEVMPGNYGMKDQVVGLQWVQDNIHAFGGDAARVTLFGESAGSVAVHCHILSPKSKGLFSRAILQSGTALNPGQIGENAREAAARLSRILRCPEAALSKDLSQCFQQAKGTEIAAAVQDFFEWLILPRPMVPRVDGDFLPDEPASLMLQGKYNRVDVMAGVNRDEGAIIAKPLFSRRDLTAALERNFAAVGPVSLNCQHEEDALALCTKIYEHYLGDLLFDEEHSEQLAQMYGDWLFKVPHDLTSQLFARDPDTKVYRYELKHRGRISLADAMSSSVGKHWITHADDLQYLFSGGSLFPENSEELMGTDDLKLRDIITTLWTNFAASGNPTPDDSLGFKWEAATEDDLRYLALEPSPAMEADRRQEVRHFLASLPTKLNKLLEPERKFTKLSHD
ncbi:juvenile hormone esterase-like [Penaeus japonicus]|uniref:juvenile hormone esterase-like n=1 Tax=Penaeus japonicus TaxID=27405 RepID=UPI001C70D602|nr:juvenile hormone esterase-like [Penaeus japonicus]